MTRLVFERRTRQAEIISRVISMGLRGQLLFNESAGRLTRFGVGGAADVLFAPADEADLSLLLRELPPEVPVYPIGHGSNILLRDGGFPGVMVNLGSPFARLRHIGELLHVGAAASCRRVLASALRVSLAGLEFLSGIPGTIGGALRMNAGAFGVEMADVVLSARVIERDGNVRTLARAAMGFRYRDVDLTAEAIFVDCTVRAHVGDRSSIIQTISEQMRLRHAYQPNKGRTVGSTFLNPPGDHARLLISKAGCDGWSVGGARLSEINSNFIIAEGDVTALEIETLIERIQDQVASAAGVRLQPEVKIVGVR